MKTPMKVSQSRFFKTQLRVSKNGVTVELPDDITEHLKLKKDVENHTVHAVIVNGVVQICGEQIKAVIPVLTEDEFSNVRA